MRIIIVALFFTLLVACKPNEGQKTTVVGKDLEQKYSAFMKFNRKYNLNKPDRIINLPESLVEISGLDFDDENLVAINDEEGKVFVIDNQSGKIKNEIYFGADGDYEGVEIVDQEIVILKSDGTLNFINLKTSENRVVKTTFTRENDLEGLAYDKYSHQLLLATKRKGLADSSKAIYSYDLVNNSLDEKPFIEINAKMLWEFSKGDFENIAKKKRKEIKGRIKRFSPSGITMDKKGNLYIISAKGSVLSVFNSDYKLKMVELLDEKVLPQPEGITFDKDQNLYISTEGKGLIAKICVFNRL